MGSETWIGTLMTHTCTVNMAAYTVAQIHLKCELKIRAAYLTVFRILLVFSGKIREGLQLTHAKFIWLSSTHIYFCLTSMIQTDWLYPNITSVSVCHTAFSQLEQPLVWHHLVAMAEREAKRQKTEKDMLGSFCRAYPSFGMVGMAVVDKIKRFVALLSECDPHKLSSADTWIDCMCTTSFPRA